LIKDDAVCAGLFLRSKKRIEKKDEKEIFRPSALFIGKG
jgi:hypothetical protein